MTDRQARPEGAVKVRCGFVHDERRCGRPEGHDGQHEHWTWFCDTHLSWRCQAGDEPWPTNAAVDVPCRYHAPRRAAETVREQA